MNDIRRWLREHFGATPPLGYCLRVDHRDRWLRVHSLPGSKRYAENDAERSEVRMRAWAAASEVLPTGTPICLVTGRYGEEPDDVTLPEAPWMRFERVGRYDHVQLDVPYVAYTTRVTWPHADFEQLIDAVAADTLQLAWFSLTSGEVFAPYDGGIDLVLETQARARALRRMFPLDWFSPRPDGL